MDTLQIILAIAGIGGFVCLILYMFTAVSRDLLNGAKESKERAKQSRQSAMDHFIEDYNFGFFTFFFLLFVILTFLSAFIFK